MQDIIIEKPYKFIPPYRGTLIPRIVRNSRVFTHYLRLSEGVVDCELRDADRFKRSLAAGHGVLVTPNHSRVADTMVLGWLACDAKCLFYAMASWHLFHVGRLFAWAMRVLGGFSIYREGVDRQALNTAIEILTTAERPLLIFPEGTTSRTNDRLMDLLDGVAFIARAAAKKRAKQSPPGKVVVHPIAIKYLYGGNLKAAVDPVLTEIEERLSWQPQRGLPLIDRITRVGNALLSLKEVEYFDRAREGTLAERKSRLVERLLLPLEKEWLNGRQESGVVPRVKAIRTRIMPELVNGKLTTDQRQRYWQQLADVYLAQQLACYPPDYLKERPSVDRILETVERFEEDLKDKARVHGQLKVIIQIGEAIEVGTQRDRTAAIDPLMQEIEAQLRQMLGNLALESPLYNEDAS